MISSSAPSTVSAASHTASSSPVSSASSSVGVLRSSESNVTSATRSERIAAASSAIHNSASSTSRHGVASVSASSPPSRARGMHARSLQQQQREEERQQQLSALSSEKTDERWRRRPESGSQATVSAANTAIHIPPRFRSSAFEHLSQTGRHSFPSPAHSAERVRTASLAAAAAAAAADDHDGSPDGDVNTDGDDNRKEDDNRNGNEKPDDDDNTDDDDDDDAGLSSFDQLEWPDDPTPPGFGVLLCAEGAASSQTSGDPSAASSSPQRTRASTGVSNSLLSSVASSSGRTSPASPLNLHASMADSLSVKLSLFAEKSDAEDDFDVDFDLGPGDDGSETSAPEESEATGRGSDAHSNESDNGPILQCAFDESHLSDSSPQRSEENARMPTSDQRAEWTPADGGQPPVVRRVAGSALERCAEETTDGDASPRFVQLFSDALRCWSTAPAYSVCAGSGSSWHTTLWSGYATQVRGVAAALLDLYRSAEVASPRQPVAASTSSETAQTRTPLLLLAASQARATDSLLVAGALYAELPLTVLHVPIACSNAQLRARIAQFSPQLVACDSSAQWKRLVRRGSSRRRQDRGGVADPLRVLASVHAVITLDSAQVSAADAHGPHATTTRVCSLALLVAQFAGSSPPLNASANADSARSAHGSASATHAVRFCHFSSSASSSASSSSSSAPTPTPVDQSADSSSASVPVPVPAPAPAPALPSGCLWTRNDSSESVWRSIFVTRSTLPEMFHASFAMVFATHKLQAYQQFELTLSLLKAAGIPAEYQSHFLVLAKYDSWTQFLYYACDLDAQTCETVSQAMDFHKLSLDQIEQIDAERATQSGLGYLGDRLKFLSARQQLLTRRFIGFASF
mmetsp:Transcript_174/g.517  ORF Transcript_174/g.517 Transcript_174/m.517 type:complete len:862 (-) Transcript_174:72-2657(-)